MKKKLMGLAFGGAFLAASLGVFGFVKAETTSEDITPNLNVVRSIEDKDQVNMYKAVIDEKGYQNITLNFDASKEDAGSSKNDVFERNEESLGEGGVWDKSAVYQRKFCLCQGENRVHFC